MERIIGIMGAMPEETQGIVDLISEAEVFVSGMRTYYSGTINGIKVVVVFSRWGKVAAATTVCGLISLYHVTDLIFIGVAGAIHQKLKIGDIVVANNLVQHDLDARPLMKKYEVPLLEKIFFQSNLKLQKLSLRATEAVIKKAINSPFVEPGWVKQFQLDNPVSVMGDVASGDQFITEKSEKDRIRGELGSISCVEMEGAAVAQVCYEYGLPFAVIRVISDQADDAAPGDFMAFIHHVASKYSCEIIREIFEIIHEN
jgi:adenosylhomocysteine nucleosidase